MKHKVLEACKQTRALLTPEKGWTQKAFARNSIGMSVGIMSPVATCYCWSGALSKVCDDPTGNRTELYPKVHAEFMVEVNQITPYAKYVVDFNDKHSHQEVLDIMDKTINRLEREIENK